MSLKKTGNGYPFELIKRFRSAIKQTKYSSPTPRGHKVEGDWEGNPASKATHDYNKFSPVKQKFPGNFNHQKETWRPNVKVVNEFQVKDERRFD